MGVTNSRTIPGDYTPICNQCGIALCYDISQEDYDKYQAFWDQWCCPECGGNGEGSFLKWFAKEKNGNK